ncbi:MAG: asparagine synthase (glutamine-hydrolyzing) [Steroidobacteraceae bacterium]
MCGINGILQFDAPGSGAPSQDMARNVRVMNDAIGHRGPDGEGVFAKHEIALGHRRLSILDLTENGAQPMFNEDESVVIVFNGEIYNYLELIPDLLAHGHRFRSRSDTEIIIHSYEEYGPDCVKRFNGMWAFALYDFRRKLLFASRDRLGVKPFYYFKDNKQLVFSSEIKAILKIVPANQANLGKVYDYVAYGYKTSNGETFFKGVSELPPATNMIIEDGDSRLERYWDLAPSPHKFQDPPDMPRVSEEFRSLLSDAVRLRFRSDVPVAILLSGGLDSTSIARTVDELIDDGRLNYTSVSAFSASFPGHADDESERVREFAATCRHVKLDFVYPGGGQLPELLETIAYGLGEPVASATSFAHYSLMNEIHKRGIKVVLNGQGSDEAFCGYDRFFLGYFLLDTLICTPGDVLAQARAMRRRLGYRYAYIASQFAKALLPRRLASYLRSKYQEGMLRCLAPEFISNNYRYLRNERIGVLAARNFDRYLRQNLQHYAFNQILHYEDHSSMQHSVEIRSPFIDYRLMEFAFSLPMHAKYDLGVTKKIVRQAFQGRLPESIIDNRRKIGFATPFGQWLTEPSFADYVRDILGSREFRARSIWDAEKLRKVFLKPNSHPHFPYWRILNLELWARAYGVSGI